MSTWYKKDLIRNLVDMHIPDGDGYLEKFDPAVYAENIKISGAQVAYIYASNCLGLSFYPTEHGLRHKAAGRDIFGNTVKECRKRGLDVVGYLNSWGSFVCDEHPEWNVLNADGKPLRSVSRYGNPCINSEYADIFISRVYELCSEYDIDGLWVDMVGMWMPVCFCDACREKYRKLYGKELPTVYDWNDPNFVGYMRFKGDSVADYARRIREAALSARPGITVSLQSAGLRYAPHIGINSDSYHALSDYCAGDFYTDRDGVNAISRIQYKLTNNLPFEFMTSRCRKLEWHTMNKDINELVLQSYASLMYKGAFLFIDAIDPDGGTDTAFYKSISVIRDNFRPYLPYTDFDEKPVREVGVYFNFDSLTYNAGNGTELKHTSVKDAYGLVRRQSELFERLVNIGAAFSDAHTDYDIISRKNLCELGNYRVIVLSSLDMLNDDEITAVRNYVLNGGNVYISGVTSLRDTDGRAGDNFRLCDVIGADYCGSFGIKPGYISPVGSHPGIFGKYTPKHPHMLNERFIRINAHEKTETLATVTLPVSGDDDITVFSSAISNPPIIFTGTPAVVRHRYGKGTAVYSAGVIENDALPDNRRLFASLIKSLLPDPAVTLDAPSCIDHTVYRSENNYKINLLNHQNICPPVPVTNVTVKLRLDGGERINKVFAVGGGDVDWQVADGVLRVSTPVDIFRMIIAEYTV